MGPYLCIMEDRRSIRIRVYESEYERMVRGYKKFARKGRTVKRESMVRFIIRCILDSIDQMELEAKYGVRRVNAIDSAVKEGDDKEWGW